jgi:LCP family protein required for cell wall assembly
MDHNQNHTSVRWQKIGLSVLCVVLALILLALATVSLYTNYLLNKIGRVNPEDDATLAPWETIPPDDHDPEFTGPEVESVPHDTLPWDPDVDPSQDGIVNILLIGQDRRPGEGRQRSDSMILCSFNTKKGTISMVSFLRDTYVYIPGYGSEKLNAAYAHGGFSCLNETLAVNFGVHVDANAEVDFSRFQQVIDLLGGVSIKLTQKEADYMNQNHGWSLTAGVNYLNGEKALAYSRIRKIDMDAIRAQRQRTVLMALIDKYKEKSVGEMITLLDDILPLVTTNMTNEEIVGYVAELFPMLRGVNIATQQIPAPDTFENMTVGKVTATKVADMALNRQILQELLGYENN